MYCHIVLLTQDERAGQDPPLQKVDIIKNGCRIV